MKKRLLKIVDLDIQDIEEVYKEIEEGLKEKKIKYTNIFISLETNTAYIYGEEILENDCG